jgi:hypothetical protein
MKITTAEGAPLMEISSVMVLDKRIVFEGKMMGGIPMKAFVPPGQLWSLLRMVWFTKAVHIAWLLFASLFISSKQ